MMSYEAFIEVKFTEIDQCQQQLTYLLILRVEAGFFVLFKYELGLKKENKIKTTKNFEKRITNLVSTPNSGLPRIGTVVLAKTKASRSTDSGRSDGDADDLNEEAGSTIMLDE
ncbi:hypothetical protein LOK49_LG04G03111, partial [Camellia lanceoleosa]